MFSGIYSEIIDNFSYVVSKLYVFACPVKFSEMEIAIFASRCPTYSYADSRKQGNEIKLK